MACNYVYLVKGGRGRGGDGCVDNLGHTGLWPSLLPTFLRSWCHFASMRKCACVHGSLLLRTSSPAACSEDCGAQSVAASFIETINSGSLSMDPDEFVARMVAGGVSGVQPASPRSAKKSAIKALQQRSSRGKPLAAQLCSRLLCGAGHEPGVMSKLQVVSHETATKLAGKPWLQLRFRV